MSKLDKELNERVKREQYLVGKTITSVTRHGKDVRYTFNNGGYTQWALILPVSVHKLALLEKALELCNKEHNTYVENSDYLMTVSQWVKEAAKACADPIKWKLDEMIEYPEWIENEKETNF